MSAHTQEQHGRKARQQAEAEQAASAASAAASGNGQDTAEAKPAPSMTCELKSDKDTVICTFDVPRKWSAGMVNTEHSALIIDTSNLRQFTNNQTANAKARAKRFAEAKTDAERLANAPLAAADYQALWTDYEGPAIGDMQRMGSAERMKLEAGWSAWVQVVTDHNTAIAAGGEPVIVKQGKAGAKVGYSIPSAKTKAESDEDFKVRKENATTLRTAFIEKVLVTPWMAERVQAQMDRLLAERGKDKAAGIAIVDTAGDSLL
jgi:hypothetical protein